MASCRAVIAVRATMESHITTCGVGIGHDHRGIGAIDRCRGTLSKLYGEGGTDEDGDERGRLVSQQNGCAALHTGPLRVVSDGVSPA